MEDFKFKSFQWLLNERKSKPCAKAKSEETKTAVAEMPKHKWLGIDELDNYKCGDAAVYIQDVNGNFWNVSDWDGSVKPNAIAVIAPEHKFLMALNGSAKAMSKSYGDTWEQTMASMPCSKAAKTDYNGAYNTQRILSVQPAEKYAAAYCSSYVFPDGTTKGYLPALGELYLAYQHKAEIDAALEKCGGTVMERNYYWSSTFVGSDNGYRKCWELKWSTGDVSYYELHMGRFVRAFASLEF